jgi:hypothetical protein
VSIFFRHASKAKQISFTTTNPTSSIQRAWPKAEGGYSRSLCATNHSFTRHVNFDRTEERRFLLRPHIPLLGFWFLYLIPRQLRCASPINRQ